MEGYLLRVAPKCGPCVKGQDTMAPRGQQNAQHPGFVDKSARYDCGQCIAWHAEQFGFPPLAPADVEAWNLYFLVQTQQRSGAMGEPMGLDYAALPTVFTFEGVPRARWRTLFHRLATLNEAVVAKRAKDAERRAMEQAAHQRAGMPLRVDV